MRAASNQDGLACACRPHCQHFFFIRCHADETCNVQVASEMEGLCQLLEHHLNALEAAQQPLQTLEQSAGTAPSEGEQQGPCRIPNDTLQLGLCNTIAVTWEAHGCC